MNEKDRRTVNVMANSDSEFGKAQAKRSIELAKKNIEEADAFIIITLKEKAEVVIGTAFRSINQAEMLHRALVEALSDMPRLVKQLIQGLTDRNNK